MSLKFDIWYRKYGWKKGKGFVAFCKEDPILKKVFRKKNRRVFIYNITYLADYLHELFK